MKTTALSVNVNKVALLRNSRHLGIPSVVRAAQLCLEAGANGITVHPRPDARHIRIQDVQELSDLMKSWPDAEFNIEGNPFHQLMDCVQAIRPHQCTLVPDAYDQLTSDHGWESYQWAELKPIVEQLHQWGVRVSLFIDPVVQDLQWVKALGVERIELYTEAYARAHGGPDQQSVLSSYVELADVARNLGIGVHAGHDLNIDNIADYLKAIPQTLEMSIGHALIADALEWGYEKTVKRYIEVMNRSRGV